MASSSIYSAILLVIALLIWAYIFSLTFLSAGWEAVMIKMQEMSPQAAWNFFEGNHQLFISFVWVVIIAHVLVTILPPLSERLNPRWYAHLAVLLLAWLAFGQSTFAPPWSQAPAPPPPPQKTGARGATKPR